jgi:hypothetical protein
MKKYDRENIYTSVSRSIAVEFSGKIFDLSGECLRLVRMVSGTMMVPKEPAFLIGIHDRMEYILHSPRTYL